jgi:hypothetical protein
MPGVCATIPCRSPNRWLLQNLPESVIAEGLPVIEKRLKMLGE